MSAPTSPTYRKPYFNDIYPFWGHPLADKIKLVAKEAFLTLAAVALDRLYPLIFVPSVVIGFVFNDYWLRKEYKTSLAHPHAKNSTLTLIYQSKLHWTKKTLIILSLSALALFRQEWILPLGCVAVGVWCGRRLEDLYYATRHQLHLAAT